MSDPDCWLPQASAHPHLGCFIFVFYVDSEVAASSEVSPLLDEETPEDQPGSSAVATRVILNCRRCEKVSVHCCARRWSKTNDDTYHETFPGPN